MGNCVAGGAYLPVLCDKILMTEGSGLYLAGPSLVKAAIGQIVDAEELGGAKMHAEISGTVDFYEKNDPSCLKRLRSLVALLPEAEAAKKAPKNPSTAPAKKPEAVYDLMSLDGHKPYDARDLWLPSRADSLDEYKADYVRPRDHARDAGRPWSSCDHRLKFEPIRRHPDGRVIYADSADKAACFIMDCNQTGCRYFFKDVTDSCRPGPNKRHHP